MRRLWSGTRSNASVGEVGLSNSAEIASATGAAGVVLGCVSSLAGRMDRDRAWCNLAHATTSPHRKANGLPTLRSGRWGGPARLWIVLLFRIEYCRRGRVATPVAKLGYALKRCLTPSAAPVGSSHRGWADPSGCSVRRFPGSASSFRRGSVVRALQRGRQF